MSDYNSGTEPCRIPLMRLLETHLSDIIHTERNNQCIRLFGAGDYRHAFEESAYQLSRLFGIKDIAILRHQDSPLPVVMASISDDELQAYGKNHIFRRKAPGYRELIGMEISTKQYKEWHRKEVMKFSPPLGLYTSNQ